MIRYCSSIAFFAMLALACASKKANDGTDTATGGGGTFVVPGTTGGTSSTNTQPITPTSGLSDLTQDEFNTITDAACVGWSSEGENLPALIDFVVDTSGSMSDIAKNTTDQRSKWAITAEALQNAIDTLPAMTIVGMLLWPNMPTVPNHNTVGIDTANCVNEGAMIPLAALGPSGSGQRSMLDGALAGVAPQGGTPMADAYTYALGYGMNASTASGPRYMVLITDGQPTIDLGCMGTGQEAYPVTFQPVLDSISSAWTTFGVETFVIGSPGSEEQSSTHVDGRNLLSEAARAGNTGPAGCSDTGSPQYCHFDMSAAADFATGFTAALQAITGQILACDFHITNVPSGQKINQNLLNVIYEVNGSTALGDMKLVAPSDPSCPQANGWYLDPNDETHVLLCANTCDLVHKDAGAVLNFRGGCDTIININ